MTVLLLFVGRALKITQWLLYLMKRHGNFESVIDREGILYMENSKSFVKSGNFFKTSLSYYSYTQNT